VVTRITPGTQFLFVCLLLAYSVYAIRRLEPGFTFANTTAAGCHDRHFTLTGRRPRSAQSVKQRSCGSRPSDLNGIERSMVPVHEYLIAFPTIRLSAYGILGCCFQCVGCNRFDDVPP